MLNLQKKESGGFSLIEMLVVLAIFSILATIVFNSFRDTRESARDTKRTADLRTMFTAMVQCERKENCGGEGQYVAYADYDAAQTGGIGTLLKAGQLPQDPLNTGAFVYTWVDNTADASTYCIYADLEEGGMYFISESGIAENVADGSDASACP